MSDDFFDILGVERRFHLAEDDLERRFHERSREVHPDRHVRADGKTRVQAALRASLLNQAYRALRDPVARAAYLLKLEGIEISDERGGRKAPPALLMDVLELREQLSEARGEGDLKRVKALAAEVGGRRAAVLAQADAAFLRYEAGERAALEVAADASIAERYFRRFLEEVTAIEEASERAAAGDPASPERP
jgi:molecular chaperone HscB